MAHLSSRRRLALAVPVALSLTASLGFLPTAAVAAPAPDAAVTATTAGETLSYVVNTRTDGRTLASVKKAIGKAGGSIVTSYDKIGVIVVHSADPSFGTTIRAVRGVESAGATRTKPFVPAATTDVGQVERATETDKAELAKASAEAGMTEPFEAAQWDLPAIGADKAAGINPGSRNVTVAVIDTGVDDLHPDLAPNFSASQSADCSTGVADTSPGAWRPADSDHYHGTHVAGEIAAARNGIGVAGVAPGVKVSGITVAQPDETQLFFTEAIVCAFVFAADTGVEITNNSYYVDPWEYNCPDDPDQKALLDAVNRAKRYATSKGTLHIASAGNSYNDLDGDAILDEGSPDDGTPVTRTIDPHVCLDMPAQLDGVVTVSATGYLDKKSYYSNYGKGVIDVAAPGGDSRYQLPPGTDPKRGAIYSTLPNGAYGWAQGTSMAAPHAAGVAALIKSTHPRATPGALAAMLKAQATKFDCPTSYDYDSNGTVDAVCVGGPRENGFYGAGIVDALKAVTK
ncbi:S8 family serine peptidase [Streptomyces sp. CO7]